MIRFKYPVGNLFIFFNAGISNAYVVSETNHLQQTKKFYGTTTPTEGQAFDKTKKYQQGYNFGFGARFRKYSIEARFENTNGISSNSSMQRCYFIVGYRLR